MKIGFIGLGNMGAPMAKNLAAAALMATAAIAGSDRATAQSYYPFTLSNGTLTVTTPAGATTTGICE